MNHPTRQQIRRITELLGWKATFFLLLAYAARRVAIWYRIKFRFVSVPFALLCAICAFLSLGCSHDHDAADHDSSQHHHRHGSYGGEDDQNRGGGGGFFSPSSTPIPGT